MSAASAIVTVFSSSAISLAPVQGLHRRHKHAFGAIQPSIPFSHRVPNGLVINLDDCGDGSSVGVYPSA
jgi:hypothetical protein